MGQTPRLLLLVHGFFAASLLSVPKAHLGGLYTTLISQFHSFAPDYSEPT